MDNKPLVTIKSILLTITSSLLLALAFPKFNIWLLAWFALVPLMFTLDNRKFLPTIGLSYLGGIVFFAATFYWFYNVTKLGMVLMILVLGLYFVLFGCGYYLSRNFSVWARFFFLPSVWVTCEYLRAHLFTGFDWASLGHSQSQCLLLIQIADLTGVFGVSFIVMMINVLIYELLKQLKSKAILNRMDIPFMLLFSSLIINACYIYGTNRIDYFKTKPAAQFDIAMVQANVAQEDKWNKKLWPEILAKYTALTEEAAITNPDMLIWPETAFPGFVGRDKLYFETLQRFVKKSNIPLLLGSVVKADEDTYYNSAILLDKHGEIQERYNKVHLVPFGEFLPFRDLFPFLTEIVPIADFSRGDQHKVFSFRPFSSLICFEDTVARLVRKFVNNGSQLLINVTNDAWFGDTKAPYLHLQSALFRSVENRRYLIQSTNTGVSAIVSPVGAIVSKLISKSGRHTFSEGVLTGRVAFLTDKSIYTRFGDVFAYICMVFVGLAIIFKKKLQ